ncbi:hypothetical protein OKW23_001466 [Bacilli bacterium PM5-9]|nr:hypothetical protein [Bacilli bacterium PM5-9]
MNKRTEKWFFSFALIVLALLLSTNVNATEKSYTKNTIISIKTEFKNEKQFPINYFELNYGNVAGLDAGNTEVVNGSLLVDGQTRSFSISTINNKKVLAFNSTFADKATNETINISFDLKVLNNTILDIDSGLNHSGKVRNTNTAESALVIGGSAIVDINIVTYPVTYHANGGSGSAPLENNKKTGQTFIVASNTFTAPEKMVFVKWNTQPDGSGISYLPNETITMNNSGINLYAIWNIIPSNENKEDNNNNNEKENDKNNNNNNKNNDKNNKKPDLPNTGSSTLSSLSILTMSILVLSFGYSKIKNY